MKGCLQATEESLRERETERERERESDLERERKRFSLTDIEREVLSEFECSRRCLRTSLFAAVV